MSSRPGSSGQGRPARPPPLSISMKTEKVSPFFAASAMALATARLSVTTRRLTPRRRSSVIGRQLGRHDAHAIEDVLEAAVGEIARLGQGRDGDAPVMALDRHAADLDRFRGLEVRTQHDAGIAQPLAHALEVAAQDRPVENEGGGRQVIEGLGGHVGEFSMPIENERKFVLKDDGDLEPRLAAAARRDHELPAPGLSRRLRHAHPLDRGGRRDPPCLHLQAAGRRPDRRDRDRDQRRRFRAAVVAAPRDPAEGALLLDRRSASTGTSTSSRPTTAGPTSRRPKSRCRKSRPSRRRCRPASPATCWRRRRPATRVSPPSAWPTGRMPRSCWPTSRARGGSSEDRAYRHAFGEGAVHLRRQSQGRRPAHLDDQQHPAGAGRDRHRHRRLGRGLLLRLHRRRARRRAQHDRAHRDRPGRARHRQALLRPAAEAAPVRPLRHHDLRPVRPRHRAVGHRRQGGRPAAASAAGRRGPRQAAGLCQPAEVPRSREGRRAHQAGGRARAIATSSCTRPRSRRSRRRGWRRATTSPSWSTPTARGRPSRRGT